MPVAAPEQLTELWSSRGRLASRYLAVSLINIFNHQVVLFIANSIWGWPGGWANLFAASIGAVPAYLLSRAWVWKVSGGHRIRGEVLPFWIITVVGLGVSTFLAAMADQIFGAGLAVNLAALVGYFIVWVAKFFLLDRLFGGSSDR